MATRKRSSKRRKKKASPLKTAFCLLLTVALVVAVAAASAALRDGYDHYVRATYKLEHERIVREACENYDISPSLAYGIIRTESGFDEYARSSADAMGLMQVTQTGLDWAQLRSDDFDDVTVADLYDPEVNIRCGVFLLHLLFEQFENEQAVIAAYNAGIGNVENWLADSEYSSDGKTLHTIPFTETRNYVDRVLASKAIYQQYYHLDDV